MTPCNNLIILIILAIPFGGSWGVSNNGNQNLESDVSESGCRCLTYNCECCEAINIFYPINGIVCTNFSYLPNDYGISITVKFNNYTLINETVSARNPPPLCIGIPELEKISAFICLKMYDLTFTNGRFHGCLEVKASVYHWIHKDVTVGCFNIPSKYKFPNILYLNTKNSSWRHYEELPSVIMI